MATLIDKRGAALRRAHARLGPSGADRWMRCAGSVEAEELEPNDENQWSAEGTVAHFLFERCLKLGFEMSDFLGKSFTQGKFTFKCDDDMVEYLQPIIDEILDTPGQHFYESKVDLSRWLPDQFGTLDVGILQVKRGWIIIRDLKYGGGLPVRAEMNYQLMIYAAGFWDCVAKHVWPKGADKPMFKIIIDQPRNDAGGGEFKISYEDLMDFMETVADAGEKTYPDYYKNGVVPRTAGDKQCSYCRAAQNLHCRDYDEWNLKKYGAKFDDYQNGKAGPKLPDPLKMDPDVRARILDMAPSLNQWIKRLHADAINDCLAGRPSGGKKAVEGSKRGPRRWKDEAAAEAWLDKNLPPDAELFEMKLISPTKAQPFLGKGGKALLAPHVVQADPKPILVPLNDPRKALETVDEKFSDFGDDDD